MKPEWIIPEWPAPPNVQAVTTTRQGGVSKPPFDSLNMAGHVGDDSAAVAANRRLVRQALSLPDEPWWLNQVHGTGVVKIERGAGGLPEADASMTKEMDCVCAVLTADCLPVLFCNRAGTQIAAAHAGWRGLLAGILEATVNTLTVEGDEILAWLGPAIGPRSFEVGEEVYQAFVDLDAGMTSCFVASKPGHWFADLYGLARRRLATVGVTAVYGGGFCTVEDRERFYSFRRDGKTGRMASLIWLQP